VYSDRKQEAPDVQAQKERPDESLDAWFDCWKS
jgi:hypothetical protein